MKTNSTIFRAMLFLCIAFGFTSSANAHGGVDLKDDQCARWAGKDIVHFNVYQPQVDKMANYCGTVPKVGPAIFVVDLVNQHLRETKVAFKLVSRADDGNETVVLDLPAKIYKQGVIEATALLEKAGYHKAYITIAGSHEDQPAMGYRVAMRSQVQAPGLNLMLTILLLAAGAVMLAMLFGPTFKRMFAKD